jgi:predicted component of type VI protein secretion system
VRWLALAGTGGAFVLGLGAQAVRGGDGTGAPQPTVVRATIAADAAAPPSAAPALRRVSLPALKAAPRRPAAPPAPAPAPTSVRVTAPAPAPAPASAPVAAPQPPPASKPDKGPVFDSSG